MTARLGRGTLLLVLACTALPASGAAQRWTLSPDMQAEVDEVFAFVGRDDPGCALGVVQNGRLVYGRGYGLANLDWGIPITTQTLLLTLGGIAPATPHPW